MGNNKITAAWVHVVMMKLISLLSSMFSSGKETEKAKERCDKATMKLHMLHNQYVLALKGAQLHQSQYYDTTLPLLLDSVQKMQEEMIKAL